MLQSKDQPKQSDNLIKLIHYCDRINELYTLLSHSERPPRTLSGGPTSGPYKSFQDVLIRRGRRKDVVSTSRARRTYLLRSTGAGT